MTKEQQKTIDGYHERVISLIYKRRRAMSFGLNGQAEYEQITAEINKIEDERRKYERNTKSSRQEERKVAGSIPGVEETTETGPSEADVRFEN